VEALRRGQGVASDFEQALLMRGLGFLTSARVSVGADGAGGALVAAGRLRYGPEFSGKGVLGRSYI
jgi:hypothetical protein